MHAKVQLKMEREVFHRLAEQQIAEHLGKRVRLLDIGCSSGGTFSNFFLQYIERDKIDYHGIDPDEYLLEVMKKVRGHFENVYLYATRFEDYDSPQNFFDIVVLSYTYHHIEDVKVAMHKIWQLLKPNGRLFVVDDFQTGGGVVEVEPEPLGPIMSELRKIFKNEAELKKYVAYVEDKKFNMIFRNPDFGTIVRQLGDAGFKIEKSLLRDLQDDKRIFFISARKTA